MNTDELVDLVHARARRRFQRGLKRKPLALIKKLRKAKKVGSWYNPGTWNYRVDFGFKWVVKHLIFFAGGLGFTGSSPATINIKH